MKNKNDYESIMHRPHHISRRHPRMSMSNRAAQFAPFSALTGYEEAIDKTQKDNTAKTNAAKTNTGKSNTGKSDLSRSLSILEISPDP
ncbi:hypothetical protein [uncultured Prevotella sp.]|uniref:hypothetical protein n=1 Tax=uncultured Prevotella sp. TaxID=159272 RepID=UPI002608B911|nr:hypothetical protein [uncultured Prevotella sp.]